MSEEHRYLEAAESDDELPLTQGAAVQVTKRSAAAVLTSQAEPRFVKVHKSRTSAKQSKQSTRRDLLTVLGKKTMPTAKVGPRGSAKDASYGGTAAHVHGTINTGFQSTR
jgi:cytochrome c biogenesis factor